MATEEHKRTIPTYQRFLDPKTDISFKKLFGDQSCSDITISFLNAVLERVGDDCITEVTIIEPANRPEGDNKKSSVVDVRCQDGHGNKYIVEMQMVDEKNFIERSQYYVATGLAQQLEIGSEYESLMPVIFVGVINFDIDPDKHFLCHHTILNTKTYDRVFNHMEFHFVELKKFNKELCEIETDVDRWIYLIKRASECREIPKELGPNAAINHAFTKLERGTWTEQEIWSYMRYRDALNRDKNLDAGGFERGLEKGKAEGALEEKRLIARQMLEKGIDIKLIADVTNLSFDQIKKL